MRPGCVAHRCAVAAIDLAIIRSLVRFNSFRVFFSLSFLLLRGDGAYVPPMLTRFIHLLFFRYRFILFRFVAFFPLSILPPRSAAAALLTLRFVVAT